ncbi:hypothetical protein [Spirosoma aerophilum]
MASGQNKQAGIGPFKIGRPTAEVLGEVAKGYQRGIKDATRQNFEGDGSSVFRLVYTGKGDAPSLASSCPMVEVYYLKKYEVAGVNLLNTYLFFFEDKLSQIQCQGSNELEQAMVVQYGQPQLKSLETKGDCVSNSNKTYSKTWVSGDMEVQSSGYYSYSTECGLSELRFFTLKLPLLELEAQNCAQRNQGRAISAREKNKQKDL